MKIQLFNTLTKRKETFKPLNGKTVLYYTCGPTVYDYAHIGNFATFVRQDLLKRVLEYFGFEVKHVMNITDIDDKTIARSKELGWTLKQLTDFYTKEFLKDMEALNIKPPTRLVPATSEIPEMIKVVSALIEKGYAYVKDGSVYFSVRKFKEYGKLSGIRVEDLKPGARVDVDEYDKENPVDFALWKKSKEEEIKRGIFWESPWGRGRPGWHIECSVIALKYLGETIDIHSGGIDLIFPHHENEIAQSEAYTGKQFARFWVHCEHILVDEKKMSKSLGNFYTLRDLLEKSYDPIAIRLLFISCHYRRQLNFTFESLKQAEKNLEYLKNTIRRLKDVEESKDSKVKDESKGVEEELEKIKKKFLEYVADDLDMPKALAVLFEFLHDVNRILDEKKLSKSSAKKIIDFLLDIDKILGLKLDEVLREEIPVEILKMLEEREKLRKEKRYEEADAIREKIRAMGYEVEDTPSGPRVWRRR